MVMQKLLFIAPHLSTGGLPQYLCKKIELLKDEFNIYLIEWVDHTGGRLVVTKNKITQLVAPERFYTLYEDKRQLLEIINDIQPDIIHLEEIPEFFMDSEIAKQIYNQDRNYIIVETSHDSSYNTENKQFFPDKFMFVSDWQINQYKDINIPKVLVEYPIEYIERPNREEALKSLGQSIIGPGGVFLAFSIVTSAITTIIQKYGSLGNAIDVLFSYIVPL